MNPEYDDRYTTGYLAGYRDGIRDVINSKTANVVECNISILPIDVMTISTQAKHCLIRAGCSCVADAVALDEHTILKTRQMGPKTASEIARWMVSHGHPYTAWTLFL